MRSFLSFVILLSSVNTLAATPTECLGGSFTACREIFNDYGSRTKRDGAVELFEKACSAQALLVSCKVVSVEKSITMKKMMEMAVPKSGMFVINGPKIDKIYQISEVK